MVRIQRLAAGVRMRQHQGMACIGQAQHRIGRLFALEFKRVEQRVAFGVAVGTGAPINQLLDILGQSIPGSVLVRPVNVPAIARYFCAVQDGAGGGSHLVGLIRVPVHILAASEAADETAVRVLQRTKIDDLLMVGRLNVLAAGALARAEVFSKAYQLGLFQRLAAENHQW